MKVSCSITRAAAGSPVMSAATITRSGTSLSPLLQPGALCCHVLYVDRGVIVLNKPPGLVSQATAPSHEDALPTRTRARAAPPLVVVDADISKSAPPPPPQSAAAVFDDVLYGGFSICMVTSDGFFFSTNDGRVCEL